jgi:hypothetical protein
VKLATLEQIRHAGLEALQRELGPTNATRFLRLFDGGKGDYTVRRRTLFRRKSVATLALEIRSRRVAA